MGGQPADNNMSEGKTVFLLCLLAAVHVFVFSATFPFFNIVDEQQHVDLVLRYSHWDVPRKIDLYSEESRPYLVLYYSPEYLWPQSTPPYRPAWKQPMENVRERLLRLDALYRFKSTNSEASQPPLYYMVAGVWWQMGKLLRLDGLALLYWLRFFNMLLITMLVWLGWIVARRVFPGNDFARISVPALIAFTPQTAFYSVNPDMFSAVTFGSVFFLLLKLWEAEKPTPKLAAITGLAMAAVYLTKLSNIPFLMVSCIFLAMKIAKLAQASKLRASAPVLGILVLCAVLPTALWMAWCRFHFGDFTGSMVKEQRLGWTVKPLSEWLHHPIFSFNGFCFFVSRNISTFWQGGFLWHGRPMAIHNVDLFYIILTLGVLLLAFVRAAFPHNERPTTRATAVWFGFSCILSAFVFYAWLSIRFDFHQCFYPSRALPYFVSGRLMLGMLIPFMIIFASGLDYVFKKFRPSLKYALLLLLVFFMISSEIAIDWGIFSNQGNWYHM